MSKGRDARVQCCTYSKPLCVHAAQSLDWQFGLAVTALDAATEDALHQAWLVVGWATIFKQQGDCLHVGKPPGYVTSTQANSASYLQWGGK